MINVIYLRTYTYLTSLYKKKICAISSIVSIYFNNNVHACLYQFPTFCKHSLLILWGKFFPVLTLYLQLAELVTAQTAVLNLLTFSLLWHDVPERYWINSFKFFSINTLLFIHLTFIVYLPDPLTLNWFFVFLLFDM